MIAVLTNGLLYSLTMDGIGFRLTADQDNPFDTVSIIYDDRKLLETRVRRLNNVNIHAESPPTAYQQNYWQCYSRKRRSSRRKL